MGPYSTWTYLSAAKSTYVSSQAVAGPLRWLGFIGSYANRAVSGKARLGAANFAEGAVLQLYLTVDVAITHSGNENNCFSRSPSRMSQRLARL